MRYAPLPAAEGLLHNDAGGVRLHISVNGENTIAGHGILFVERFQISDLDFLHRIFRAEGVETVAYFTKESSASGFESAGQQLIFLRADCSALHLTLTFQLRRRKCRFEQYVGNQVQSDAEIAAHDFRVEAKAVVTAIA